MIVTTYKSVEINLQESGFAHAGEFSAAVGGKVVYKKSVAAMKTYIDKQNNAAPFEKFKAWVRSSYNDNGKFVVIEVTGVAKDSGYGSRRNGGRFRFITTPSVQSYTQVYVRDAANARAYEAARKFQRETDKINEERSKEKERLSALVKYHKPEDFIK